MEIEVSVPFSSIVVVRRVNAGFQGCAAVAGGCEEVAAEGSEAKCIEPLYCLKSWFFFTAALLFRRDTRRGRQGDGQGR